VIYQLSLHAAGVAVGLCLLVIGAAGLISSASFRELARKLPRSRIVGILLLTAALLWTLWLLATIEMGEFSSFRRPLLIALPIGYILVLRFVDEFLAVRALGILCLLLAEPLLDAAFLRYETSRLLVTVFAYVLVIAGLFWVTMPYLLRDQINWTAKSNTRWRLVNGLALVYGAATLAVAMTQY
jgi:F0F1-type ATP synthase membrane subunit c/vacuolar-type H+-ATPase subunit K